MSKSIPPQSLSWRIDVEPYPAISWTGVGFVVTRETWTYTAYYSELIGHWQTIEHDAFGGGDSDLRTLGKWPSVDALVADPDANPPSWLVDAMRAIEADR